MKEFTGGRRAGFIPRFDGIPRNGGRWEKSHLQTVAAVLGMRLEGL